MLKYLPLLLLVSGSAINQKLGLADDNLIEETAEYMEWIKCSDRPTKFLKENDANPRKCSDCGAPMKASHGRDYDGWSCDWCGNWEKR